MAAGDVLDATGMGFARKNKLISMLETIGANNSGKWIDGKNIEKASIEFLQDTAGTLTSFSATIMGSNAKDTPADATDGFAIGAAVTAVGGVAITTPARFYKIKVTAISVAGGATIGARMHAHTYGG